MPVIRGTDGTPVSVPTSYEDEKRGDEAQQDGRQNAGRASLFGDSAGDGSGAASGTASGGSSGDGAGGGAEDKTLPPGQHAGRDAGQAGNKGGLMPADMPTKLAPGKSAARASGGGAEPKTKIAGPAKRRASASGDASAATATQTTSVSAQAQDDPMGDPVVGWLVVIDGPGKGHHLKLGYGQNSIGRGEGQRVRLDFGDSEISRDNHAMLTYDPRGRAFYIQQGAGTNLTYMNGAPVLSPTQLQPMNRIALGATTLLFVPLCGDAFNWDDAE